MERPTVFRIAAIGLGLLLIGSCAPRWVLGPSAAAVEVTVRDLRQTLVLNGRVLAPRRVNLGAPLAGTVARRLVEEGDRVKAGQALVQLEDGETRAAQAQAQARLEQVREVASPAGEASLAQAEATLLQAEASHLRTERLHREGVLPLVQLEDVRRALDVARAARDAARVQARSVTRGAELRTAAAALAMAQARLDQMVLRAPLDGVVLTRSVEVGDAVSPGRTLFTLVLDEPLQLLVQPDEKHLAQLRLGQAALASADAFPGERFAAEVGYIAPAVDLQRGTIDVKLRVPKAPASLRADMTISVEIDQGLRPKAIALPMAAVRGLPDRPHVLVRRQGRAVEQPVQLGFRGEKEIEILEGLRPGEQVFLDPVKPGQRLRARL